MSPDVVKFLHLTGFAGCLVASFWKNLLVRRTHVLEGASLLRVVRLDRVSGISAGVILLTGLALLGGVGRPAATYLHHPLLWVKVGLFTAASLAILSTKPMLRQAKAAGALKVSRSLTWILNLDLLAILTVAIAGRGLAILT